LYKLISPKQNDAMELFSQYQSGSISAIDLKNRWARLIQTKTNAKPNVKNLANKFMNKTYWSLIDSLTSKVVTTFEAPTKDDALKKAIEYTHKLDRKLFWHIIPAKY
jgi:hypothetical protein